MGELLPRVESAGGAGEVLRHRPQHRRRGGRPARTLARPPRGALRSIPELAGWNGLGFVIQAYGKRCPSVIDWLIDLGAPRQAAADGPAGQGRLLGQRRSSARRSTASTTFPVFTRKVHTDVAYLACARKLLAAPGRGLSAIRHPQRADARLRAGHRRAQFLSRPIRVPVPARHGRAALRGGRRPRQARPAVPRLRAGRLARDAARLSRAPAARERRQHLVRQPHRRRERRRSTSSSPIRSRSRGAIQPVGAPHDKIAAPRDLYGPERANSRGLDLSNEQRLAALADGLDASARPRGAPFRPARRTTTGRAGPQSRRPTATSSAAPPCGAPTRSSAAIAPATAPRPLLPRSRRPSGRRSCAAPPTLLEARNDGLVGLIVREAGKSYANAVGEVREAVDFLRYYADEARAHVRSRLPGRRSASSSASARGTSRWRSSPARSPPRSPPAMR